LEVALLHEAISGFGVAPVVGPQDLDGYAGVAAGVLLKVAVSRQVDLGIPSPTKQALDLIAITSEPVTRVEQGNTLFRRP